MIAKNPKGKATNHVKFPAIYPSVTARGKTLTIVTYHTILKHQPMNRFNENNESTAINGASLFRVNIVFLFFDIIVFFIPRNLF